MRKGHWKCVTITLDCTAFSFLIWINLTSKQDIKGWKNRSTDRKFSRKYSRKSSFEVLFAGGRVIEQRPQGREREKAQNGRFSAILRRASATQSGERLGICLSKKKTIFYWFSQAPEARGVHAQKKKMASKRLDQEVSQFIFMSISHCLVDFWNFAFSRYFLLEGGSLTYGKSQVARIIERLNPFLLKRRHAAKCNTLFTHLEAILPLFSFHCCKASHSVGRKLSFQQSFLLTQIDQVSDWLKLERDSKWPNFHFLKYSFSFSQLETFTLTPSRSQLLLSE